jgi:hypothetical protein
MSIDHLDLRLFHIDSLPGNHVLESYSNHIEFYVGRASRKTNLFFTLFMILPEMMLLYMITDPYPNDSHSNHILKLMHENFNLLPLVCFIFNLLIMFAFTQRRISTAKEALSGTLIDINPRYRSFEGIGILTKVHPNDSEIGKPIHMNFNNNLKSGDILFLGGAQVTKVKKEEYTWTETIQSYQPYSRDDEGERYGYGGGQREISGTSIRTHTTLTHDGITYFGGAFKAKKGDVIDVIVQISGTKESGVLVHHMKTLSLASNNHEEE